jgi:RNA polymerase sigma-70 factor, ECF subfamily
MVLGLCRLLLRDPVEAEDAAQQVFLSAHQAILRGSPPRDQAAWMAAIARNECRGRIRARMREPFALSELPSDLPDPLAAAIRAADLKAVWLALGELPRRQRNALVLRELGGLSYHELGRALGVSHSAIESLLFRARERVRSLVAGSNVASLGIALRELLVRVFPDQSAVAWKLAGAAVGVSVVATGAGSLHPHVAVRPHVVVPAAAPPLHRPAVAPAPVREHVAARARPPATPPQDSAPARTSQRDRPVRSAEPAEQAAVNPEPADHSEPAEGSTPEEGSAEPTQQDEPDIEWDSGSDKSVDSEPESDDGSDDSGPG